MVTGMYLILQAVTTWRNYSTYIANKRSILQTSVVDVYPGS
jgi:hypothetical protein